MLAKFFLVLAVLCVFCGGIVVGRGWRQWGDDHEFAPGTLGLCALYLLAAIASFVAGSLT